MALSGFAAGAELSAKMDTYCLATTLLASLLSPRSEDTDPTTPLALANLFERRELVPLTEDDLPGLTGEPRTLLAAALKHWLARVPADRATSSEMAEGLDVLLAEEREAAAVIERLFARQRVALQRVRLALAAMLVAGVGAGLFTYSKRETLRLAGELARVRAAGVASFEELDTCVAAHALTRRDAMACEETRREQDDSHAGELANIAGQSGAARLALERRMDNARLEKRECEDDAKTSGQLCTADKKTLTDTLTTRTEGFGRERDRLTGERDDARRKSGICDTGLVLATASRAECQGDLASCIEDRETCMSPPEPETPPAPVPAAANPVAPPPVVAPTPARPSEPSGTQGEAPTAPMP
ncbi:MAG: hypothetical protein EXR75_15820 [Myxococcales bacterium]|nr:hypothetical protein [Myxococcales bacterium]